MPYEIKKSKNYNHPFEKVYRSAYLCTKKLGGKILKHDPDNKELHVQMDKKLKGDVLGDRSKLEISFVEISCEETSMSIYGFPLNAVGQKLMFGARPGVVEKVLTVFFEEVEKKLMESAE
jgi:hypothetical protein